MFLLTITALLVTVSTAYDRPTCAPGRHTIVHLFMWKWTDIALECERFLGPYNFCGVQVSPPNEHRVVTSPNRPWWERYQPVSYALNSSSGTEDQFRDMVERCNNVKVHIYVDAVFNHMTAAGIGSGIGSAGNQFNAGTLSFPAYSPRDFNPCSNCPQGCGIENYGDIFQVRNCRLLTLLDLKLSSSYVRSAIAGFLNNLIGIGVAGFRVDAAKHMWPGDMDAIYQQVNNLNERWFVNGTKPFMYNEVIDHGAEPIKGNEYFNVGRVTEFRWGRDVGYHFRRKASLAYLKNIGESWGYFDTKKSLTFVDNHDNQRGHGAGGSSILTHKEPRWYKMATAFTLAHPYGFTRIMSSYNWHNTGWMGPPGGENISDVPITSDGVCGNGWICEHRWRQIFNMVAFRNKVAGSDMKNWWDNGRNQIAFSRGNRGFIAINNEEWHDMNVNLQTGMQEGTYCDIISGTKQASSCTGKSLYVDSSGKASLKIGSRDDDPVVAFHIDSYLGPGSNISGPVVPPATPPMGFFRTIVLLHTQTRTGQNVFIRGGIDHNRKSGCNNVAATSSCAIAIRHNNVSYLSHYDKYNAWKVGDTYLDWYGEEPSQGSYMGEPAHGSPTVWTTNSVLHDGYQPVNRFGNHYWMLDVNMDCNQTRAGWFEFKGFATNYFVNSGWETNIRQDSSCSGLVGGSAPYTTDNHLGRCGYLNVFTWNDNNCRIEYI